MSRVALAGSFVVLGAALGLLVLRAVISGNAEKLPVLRQVALVLALYGIVVWLLRGTDILLDDYDLGFKVVHTILAVVTIGLGVVVVRRMAPIR